MAENGTLEEKPTNPKMSENEKDEKPPANCNSLLVKYFKETSLYGFPRLFKAKLIGLKIFWVIWIFFCVCIIIYVIATRITHYLSYPRETTTSVEYLNSAKIPAITICDLGWDVKHRSYSTSESVLKYPEYHQKITQQKDIIDSSGVASLNQSLYTNWGYISERGYSESIGLESVKLLSKPREQFVLKCHFKDPSDTVESCDARYNVQQNIQRMDLPNCYTYTPKDGVVTSGSAVMSLTLHAGPGSSLPEYSAQEVDDTRGQVAAKVIFHDKMAIPDMRNDGYVISPGNFYHFDLEVTEYRLLSEPYGACQEIEHGEMYSKSDCERQHKMEQVLDRCECLPGDAIPKSQNVIQNNNFCGYLHEDDFDKTLGSINCYNDDSQLHPHCPVECERSVYNGKHTFSNWPNGAGKIGLYNSVIKGSVYENHFRDKYEEIKQMIAGSGNVTEIDLMLRAEKEINEQFLRLDVNFHSLTEVKVFEDHVSYTISEMFASFCIELYFFVGLTAYTFAEIIELIVLCMCGKKVAN